LRQTEKQYEKDEKDQKNANDIPLIKSKPSVLYNDSKHPKEK